ncbi:MAG: CDP-diacylglycerol--glycerol-3-phosphate 3-phosphatidyltransferase [Thermoleophilia bacterium]|nr:CDP-diacylglycerol--glycerol-3-phosphate 3-phosphatidyltransferase [Thermoleophilia bacterium]
MSGASLLVRLTSLRIALVPAVMGLILLEGDWTHWEPVAAAVFAAAAATDFLDGYLARRWQVTSALGSFLDTTADKLLVSGALIALVAVDRTSAWIAMVVVGRELVILALRGMVASEGSWLEPSVWGKLKTNVQFVAVLLAVLRPGEPLGPLYLDEWVMLAAAFVTVMSAVEYLTRFAGVLGSAGSSR